jgi:hypothetical protein
MSRPCALERNSSLRSATHFTGRFDLQRGEGDRDVFGIGAGLHAETTTHIAHHHAHLFFRKADGGAHGIAHARGHLRAHADREAIGLGVVRGEHRARLDGEGDHALVDDVERDHVAGLGEGGGRGLAAAVPHLGGDVAGGLFAQLRRAIAVALARSTTMGRSS